MQMFRYMPGAEFCRQGRHFTGCTEWGWGWGWGAGAYRPWRPEQRFFTAPCDCGLQHRGPWGRSLRRRRDAMAFLSENS